tara:strand:+ start:967 stop:1422 length:456 start_codon:yes stop_codon:yes gene_type:complete
MLKKLLLLGLLSFSGLVTVLAKEYPIQTRCVLSERAQLYLAPSDKGMAWPTPRYTPLRHIDTNADWHLIEDFEGDRFWVHNQYVTDNGFLICGVLKTMAVAYDGPGLNHELVGTLPALTGLRIIEYTSGWIHGVSSDDQEVWVPEATVKIF